MVAGKDSEQRAGEEMGGGDPAEAGAEGDDGVEASLRGTHEASSESEMACTTPVAAHGALQLLCSSRERGEKGEKGGADRDKGGVGDEGRGVSGLTWERGENGLAEAGMRVDEAEGEEGAEMAGRW